MEQISEQFMTSLNDMFPSRNYVIELNPNQRNFKDNVRDFMNFVMSLSVRGKPEWYLEDKIIKKYPNHTVNVISLDDEGQVFEIDIVGPEIIVCMTYEDTF